MAALPRSVLVIPNQIPEANSNPRPETGVLVHLLPGATVKDHVNCHCGEHSLDSDYHGVWTN